MMGSLNKKNNFYLKFAIALGSKLLADPSKFLLAAI